MRAHTRTRTHTHADKPHAARRGCAAASPRAANTLQQFDLGQLSSRYLDNALQAAKLSHEHRCTLKVPAKLRKVAEKFVRMKIDAYICRQIQANHSWIIQHYVQNSSTPATEI